jgi:hypothetical protein
MPGLLDGLERSIDRRFALYRAMSAKALKDGDGGAEDLDPEIVRSALESVPRLLTDTRMCGLARA